ncbi:hypothetical protein ACOSQ3_024423 [Xanthoceras sorbifolium]
MNAERYTALKEEVDKLLANGFIKESYYPNWLSNPNPGEKEQQQMEDGIEANLEKIKALRDMRSPTKLKYMQSLNGRVTALIRFISKSTDKYVPLFNVLRGSKKFKWTEEYELTFQQLKEYMGQAPPVVKTTRRGEAHRLSSGNSVCYKRGLSMGRDQDPATGLLCEQKAIRRREQIPADGEARLLLNGGIKEAATLLPDSQY